VPRAASLSLSFSLSLSLRLSFSLSETGVEPIREQTGSEPEGRNQHVFYKASRDPTAAEAMFSPGSGRLGAAPLHKRIAYASTNMAAAISSMCIEEMSAEKYRPVVPSPVRTSPSGSPSPLLK